MNYLGVDGGGTKTIAVVSDEKGNIIASASGKTINFSTAGMMNARENLKNIVGELYEDTGIERYDAVFAGCSAVDGRADSATASEFFGGAVSADRYFLDSDYHVAFEGMRTNGPCAIIISGTDSVVYGRTDGGGIIRKGGWGYLLGDEGSGYAIANEGMKAALRGFDRSGPQTLLTDALLDYFEVSSLESLLRIFYKPAIQRFRIAKFSKHVLDCVMNGDAVATQIVTAQCLGLAATAASVLREMPAGTPLAFWGGVLQNSQICRDIISSYISEEFPETRTGLPAFPPETGAVFAAIKETGGIITPSILENAAKYRSV